MRLEPAESTIMAAPNPFDHVVYEASCRDPEGGVVSLDWRFPGGSPSSGTGEFPKLVTYTYQGAFTTTCTCTDALGKSSELTWTVIVRDEPVALRIAVDPPVTARMRELLSRSPAVRVTSAAGDDVARAGISITASVAGGEGGLAGTATRVTDASGTAVFGDLAFTGTAVGARSLVFTAAGLTEAASANIQISPGPPATAQAASAMDQIAAPGAAVSQPPAVLVRDLDGNPVTGARVDFTVVSGGGVIAGTPAVTRTDGEARLSSWALGAAGPQAVTAAAAALPGAPVTFTATARSAATQYDITLSFVTTPTAAQRDAFLRAKARIEAVVTGDLPAAYIAAGATCGNATFDAGSIDDLHIVAELAPIDGVGRILGQAGPCYIRSNSGIPAVGMMRFDTADLQSMELDGQLDAVVLHEMLHVLGIGTIWPSLGLTSGTGTSDPLFVGANAREAFLGRNGGASYPGTPVPVENTGGTGTANSHWRESVFGRELMTGWISGPDQPMSLTTVESLHDCGYQVNSMEADAFDIRSPLLRSDGVTPRLDLANDHLPITIQVIDESGRPLPVTR
jgi:hypothetical protein